jgi:F0F1-type ATP synthase membrane subunit b/b'
MPRRPPKAQIPTLETIQEEIKTLADDVAQSKQDYQHVSQNLDEYYAPLKAAEARVIELRAQLETAEAELAELQAEGTPLEGYGRFISRAEARVANLSRQIIARLAEDAAQKTFNVAYDLLSDHGKHDIRVQFEGRFRRFHNFERVHLLKNPAGATIDSHADRVLQALEYLSEEGK